MTSLLHCTLLMSDLEVYLKSVKCCQFVDTHSYLRCCRISSRHFLAFFLLNFVKMITYEVLKLIMAYFHIIFHLISVSH